MLDHVKRNDISQRVLRNTASNLAGKLLFLISGFFLTPFILHRLGVTQFGLWALVGSVVAYGSLLDFGIGAAIIKYVAELRVHRHWNDAQTLLATALWLYSLMALLGLLLSIVIAPFFPRLFHVPPEQRSTAVWLVILMGSGMAISIPCTITTAVLRGLQRYDLVSLLSTVGLGLYVAGTVLVLSVGWGILQLVAVSIGVNLLMQVPALWFIGRVAPEIRFGWRGAERRWVRRVLSLSAWLFIMDCSGRIQTRTDEVVIGAFLPISFITPFTIARRLSEVGQIVTDQFLKILMPLASELEAENDLAHLRALYLAGTRVTLAILCPIFCILVFLARSLLTIWVGPVYADYSHLVIILALASLVDTSVWPAGSILQGIAQPRPLAITAACAAVANLALSIILVRPFGLTGVALGTLIPSIVMSLGFFLPYVMGVMNVRTIELFTEALIPAFVPVAPMAIVIYFLEQVLHVESLFSSAIVATIGMSVYVITYIALGASNLERQTYRNIVVSAVRYAEARLKH
jgi:O-antigen/teichoic acid export membrane protein